MRNTQADDENGAVRFSVSMEPELLQRLDELAGATRTRSKVVRDLLRAHLARTELSSGRGPAVGVLTYAYDHDQPDLARRLMDVQHDHHAEVVASTHVHLDRHECLEVLILRGTADRIQRLADQLLGLRGVRQGRLALTPARCPLARAHHIARTKSKGRKELK
ncbi:nickel-responsive transcriptional regulator NikR [candidate division WOR-3 bacterium]|nr:nickel-responsive transcriptional regulator NikR [candidate division WOR-3 bacterium]